MNNLAAGITERILTKDYRADSCFNVVEWLKFIYNLAYLRIYSHQSTTKLSTYTTSSKSKTIVRIRARVKNRRGVQSDIIYSSQLISLYHLAQQTNITYYTAIEAVREGSLRSINLENTFYVVRKLDRNTLPTDGESLEIVDSSQLISAKYFAKKNDFSYRKVWHTVNDGLLPAVQIGNRLYIIEKPTAS